MHPLPFTSIPSSIPALSVSSCVHRLISPSFPGWQMEHAGLSKSAVIIVKHSSLWLLQLHCC